MLTFKELPLKIREVGLIVGMEHEWVGEIIWWQDRRLSSKSRGGWSDVFGFFHLWSRSSPRHEWIHSQLLVSLMLQPCLANPYCIPSSMTFR